MKLILNIDGAARGNPGPAAVGVVIKDSHGKVIHKSGNYIGETTNNQAEYKALILALEEATYLGASEMIILADSELLVKQIKGEYRVKNPGLRLLFDEACKLLRRFGRCSIRHIPREQNREADKLANKALDERI